MNSKFLDTLHEQNAEILKNLHELRVIMKAMDELGMISLGSRLWGIYEGINSANKQILDAYSSALQENVAGSFESMYQTFEAVSKETINE